ncbi:hypothetical protein L484_020774 [Morus notabilis]|uniref:Uncharacterized protein n=1 Tax=Morus notabilis TaxID=981085 RepID=W9RV80_9ROSA|nr:hypothetical protein L484_020774 [Morus notabilis]
MSVNEAENLDRLHKLGLFKVDKGMSKEDLGNEKLLLTISFKGYHKLALQRNAISGSAGSRN